MIKEKILSIDYGTKKSGLAYSVEGFAFVYGTVPTRDLEKTIEKVITEKNITRIIIGMPYNIDGTMSRHGQRVQSFGKIIEKKFGLPISYQDERLTSSESRITFAEDGIHGDIDTESARRILEEYLSRNIYM